MGIFQRFEHEAPALVVAGTVAFISFPIIFFMVGFSVVYLTPRYDAMAAWLMIFPGIPLTFVLTLGVS
ncbi:MAG: hypothetical protein JO260_04035 [Acidobacteria bacterium]|nr:hypothetical protein [Acidobacteriota bacterium]